MRVFWMFSHPWEEPSVEPGEEWWQEFVGDEFATPGTAQDQSPEPRSYYSNTPILATRWEEIPPLPTHERTSKEVVRYYGPDQRKEVFPPESLPFPLQHTGMYDYRMLAWAESSFEYESWYCTMCDKWASDAHMKSDTHQRNLKYQYHRGLQELPDPLPEHRRDMEVVNKLYDEKNIWKKPKGDKRWTGSLSEKEVDYSNWYQTQGYPVGPGKTGQSGTSNIAVRAVPRTAWSWRDQGPPPPPPLPRGGFATTARPAVERPMPGSSKKDPPPPPPVVEAKLGTGKLPEHSERVLSWLDQPDDQEKKHKEKPEAASGSKDCPDLFETMSRGWKRPGLMTELQRMVAKGGDSLLLSWPIRILYMFSGEEREGSLASEARAMGQELGVEVEV